MRLSGCTGYTQSTGVAGQNSGYLPATRLLHVSAAPRVRGFADGVDIAPLRARALGHLAELSTTSPTGTKASESLEGGFWAAAPGPGLQIVLVALKPVAFDSDAVDGPPQGASLVVVRDGSNEPVEALLRGLSPPSPGLEQP